MSRADALLSDYASHHTTKGNVACHFLGIPLIVFGIFSMLQTITLARFGPYALTCAEVVIAAATVYYFSLDLRLAFAMLFTAILLDGAALKIGDWRVGLAAFVVGWIFQGVGHAVYEKKSPSFLKNVVHLLIGPLFLLNEVLHVRSITAAGHAA